MKNNLLDTKDYIVFAVYFVIVAAYGRTSTIRKNPHPQAQKIIS